MGTEIHKLESHGTFNQHEKTSYFRHMVRKPVLGQSESSFLWFEYSVELLTEYSTDNRSSHKLQGDPKQTDTFCSSFKCTMV